MRIESCKDEQYMGEYGDSVNLAELLFGQLTQDSQLESLRKYKKHKCLALMLSRTFKYVEAKINIINGCLCLQFGLICLNILSWMWTKSFTLLLNCVAKVVYISFDKFLLAIESRDLSQADKSIIRVPSFPKLSDG